jgi:hypothetical protein
MEVLGKLARVQKFLLGAFTFRVLMGIRFPRRLGE